MVKPLAKHKRILLAALKNVLSDLVSCREHFHCLTGVHAFIKAFVVVVGSYGDSAVTFISEW